MRLTKEKLIKSTQKGLIELGYTWFKDSITGADGLFIKRIQDGFFLTLGLNKSRFYEARFTGSFYLSKMTVFAASWGDIPQDCYRRAGVFLTAKERIGYLDAEFHGDGPRDAWWIGDSKEVFQSFIDVVSITEPRFLNQNNLFGAIEKSNDVNQLLQQSELVLKIAKNIDISEKYEFIPEKEIDGIPIVWFCAAEKALKSLGGILNKNTVKGLAGDAWRQKSLSASSIKTILRSSE